MATLTGYSLALGGQAGYINIGGWNTTLTDVSTSPKEVCGIKRQEGANTYMYAYMGTCTMTWSGRPLKLTTSLVDGDGNVAPVTLTALGATAAGYFSAVAVSLQTCPANKYMWFLVEGFATLPLNSNTSLLAFGSPLAPSSSSAGWADCAAASAVARTIGYLGGTPTTASTTAEGGIFAYIKLTDKFI